MPNLRSIAREVRDISYCNDNPEQSFDLYLPAETDFQSYPKPYPLVIYVHGGGWSSGDKRDDFADYYGSALVEAGFAFASINYRLAPRYHYPAQNNDVACAVEKLTTSVASDYNLDAGRVVFMGDSAGGLLVSDYALSADYRANIKGVVIFYGTTDLVYQLNRTRHRSPNAYNYLGTKDVTTARKASPLYYEITHMPPPFLFFHGVDDKVVSLDQAYKFYKRIAEYQPSSKFIRVSHAGHGFSNSSKPSRTEIRNIVTNFVLSSTGVTPIEDTVEHDAPTADFWINSQKNQPFDNDINTTFFQSK